VTQIVCSGVGYDYPGGVRALDGLDLVIGRGERVAIVGQNGSGKTTLIRHFNGLLRPSAGRVTVEGHDTSQTAVARLAAIVALAFQDPDRQIFAGSVEDEVAFGARNLGRRGPDLESAIAASLDTVGLSAERKTNPYDLGYSRRKLLTIASVLGMDTPFVVLDEPTTGQDARGVRMIQAIVERLAGEHKAVICVSHDMDFVAESFSRLVVMRQGSIVLDGSPAEVFAAANWASLRSTNLQPPHAAVVSEKMGLGSMPTRAALVAALTA